MESKIQELTTKLLNEGVEKGKIEAEKIIAAAKEESAKIVANAKSEAADIEAAAKKNADAIKENTVAELKMYSAQALSALKTEVTNVLTDATVEDVVKKTVPSEPSCCLYPGVISEARCHEGQEIINVIICAKPRAQCLPIVSVQ